MKQLFRDETFRFAIFLLILILALLSFLIYKNITRPPPGIATEVQLFLGASEIFTQDELTAGANTVCADFPIFRNYTLLSLWYDEEESMEYAKYYIQHDPNAEKLQLNDVLILHGKFEAKKVLFVTNVISTIVASNIVDGP